MSSCPASCTGTCPEIVPVEITQNIMEFGTDVEEYAYEGTGNGSDKTFDMGYEPTLTLGVSVGGVDQPPSAYSIAGTNITFDDAPGNGEKILVRMLKEA